MNPIQPCPSHVSADGYPVTGYSIPSMQPRYIYRLIVESSRVISMTGPQTQLPVAVRYTHRETAFGDYVALVGLVRVWFLSGSSMLYPVPVPVACTCMFNTHTPAAF